MTRMHIREERVTQLQYNTICLINRGTDVAQG